ncbi:MAG TPA: Rad52/Rad22 family DNA repair protein [Edaphobacter sp.]|nr:Rad52/Rad22 family DNA repair protein [Edaphobacter sp.]
MTAEEQSAILAQLGAPFSTNEIKWRVTHTSRDGKRGAVIPFADQRAYTDRLNKVVTPSGWTREYLVTTVTNISRNLGRERTIQTGKILVTCIVTIPGVGAHSGSGEEWADDDNAMTSAEAQAFKRACSCFGLGRYFYDVAEQWVEVDEYKRPKQTPKLGVRSAAPENQQTNSTAESSQEKERPSAGGFHPSAKAIEEIESYKELLGDSLYQEVLAVIGKSQTARSLPSEESVNAVLHWLQRAANGIQKARNLAEGLSVGEFEHVLNGQKIRRLNAVPTMKALGALVVAFEEAVGKPRRAA